jgi:hypothetical protein
MSLAFCGPLVARKTYIWASVSVKPKLSRVLHPFFAQSNSILLKSETGKKGENICKLLFVREASL